MSTPASSPVRTLLSTLPTLLLLLFAVAHSASETVQSRLLAIGERTWPGYSEIRFGVTPPPCDPASFIVPEAPPPGADADPLAGVVDPPPGADPLAGVVDPPPGADPLAGVVDPPPGADPLAGVVDPPPGADPLAGVVDPPPGADPLAGVVDPPPGADADPLANLDGPPAGGPSREAVLAAKAECEAAHKAFTAQQALVTPEVERFRSAETTLAVFTESGRSAIRPLLVLMLLIGALTATVADVHIRLREPTNAVEHRVSHAGQLVVNLAAAASSWSLQGVLDTSGMLSDHPWMPTLWGAGFATMAAVNVWRIAAPTGGPGAMSPRALLTVPLYAVLGFWAAVWFLLGEQHPAGLAIYLDKLSEQAPLYVQVGLYVWAGMLLKQTRTAELVFDVLRPWKLPAEVLAAVVVVLASVPTAYSGASGIFVIAAGGTIYQELRRAGARNQLALAATALSGSLGVVLSPCLLVVIVAALNKQVTTVELFTAGQAVFFLSAALFVGAMLWRRQGTWTLTSIPEAMDGSTAALGRLLPYVAVFGVVLLGFGLGLETWLNEHSATTILLVALLGMVAYERLGVLGAPARPLLPRLSDATDETTGHIGALLALMAFSAAFGGIVERSHVMDAVPTDLGGPLPAMTLLTVALVFVGMFMDPYGAVILVSATLAHVAYANGIKPVHFWMTVLVAFELGYLTPPVALNQLLTAAVVGPEADDPDLPKRPTFFDRHERYLLPVGVMATTLLIVAFGPLLS